MLGDGERVVHCFERECSLQRRRQKVWEEAPSPAIDDATRRRLCLRPCGWPNASVIAGRDARISLRRRHRRVLLYRDEHANPGRASNYRNDHRDRSGARNDPDCAGRALSLTTDGCAVARRRDRSADQCRGSGPEFPAVAGPGRRHHAAGRAGRAGRLRCSIRATSFRPTMTPCLPRSLCTRKLGMLALARLRRALDEFEIDGVVTTAGLHKRLARLTEVQAARFDTGFLERLLTARRRRRRARE